MSKIGFHVSAGERDYLRDALIKGVKVGAPIPFLYSVGQNLAHDIASSSPTTKLIFRTQVDRFHDQLGDGPPDLYTGNPKKVALAWFDRVAPVWEQNKADFYSPFNEQDPALLEQYKNFNDVTCELMLHASARGYKLAIYGQSSGNPRDETKPAAGPPYTRYDALAQLLPSMLLAKNDKHILLLHEYAFGSMWLRLSTPHLALRYRSVARFLDLHEACPDIVISELSPGVGFEPNGRGDYRSKYIDDVLWYANQVSRDRRLVGACLYQLGGVENLSQFMPTVIDRIINERTDVSLSVASVVPGPDKDSSGVFVQMSMPPTTPPISAYITMTVQIPLLRVRAEPNLNAKIVGVLRKGEKVSLKVTGASRTYRDGTTWRETESGHWIAESQLIHDVYLR